MSEAILINKTSGSAFSDYAILRILAPVGSTVSITSATDVTKTIPEDKSKSYNLNGDYSVYYFNIPTSLFGTFTITATRGEFTVTQTKNISNNVEYNVELTYRCPSAYKEVEWVWMPAKSYIQTQNQFSGGGYMMDLIISREEDKGGARFISPHNSSACSLAINDAGQITVNEYGYPSDTVNFVPLHQFVHIVANENNNYKILVDGRSGTTNYAANYWSPNTNKLLINCCYHQVDGQYAVPSVKYKQVIIKQNSTGTIMLNLIPCYKISDGTIGMYDSVAGVFYANTGAGAFIKGPDI